MANNNDNWYARISKIFRSPTTMKRRIRDYREAPKTSTAMELFSKSQSFVYSNAVNSYGQYDRLSRYADFCFAADTLVYTTKGTYTIKQLADGIIGQRFHVYSYDHKSNTVVIGDAHSPRIARNGDIVKRVRVTFDDGGYVDVTPDHKMMLRDGSYEEAQNLKVGQSLMPFYVRTLEEHDGYKLIYTMDKTRWKGGWLAEHIMIAERFIRKLQPDEEVHHKDFNPRNNLLENLEILHKDIHKRYHSQLNNHNKFGKANSRHSQYMFENNPVVRHDITYQNILDLAQELDWSFRLVSEKLGADANVIKRRLRKAGFKNWIDFKNRREEAIALRTHESIVSETRSPQIDEILAIAKQCEDIYQACAILKCSSNSISRRLKSHGYGTWSEFVHGKKFENKKSIDPVYDETLTYQMICDAYNSGDTYNDIAKKLNTTPNKVITRITREGYKSYHDWTTQYQNHKVVSVHEIDDDIVYNLTVEGHHNLAVGSLNPQDQKDKTFRQYSMVFAKQSEMEYTPEISAALDIYADESVSQDEKGKSLHIFSDNRKVKQLLEELFYDTLNVDFNLRMWVRNIAKYGDFFIFNDVAPKYGIVQAFPIPVNEIEREEGYDPEDPQAVRFRWITQGNVALENWQVTHFRMLGNDAFLPYGSSLIEPARRVWRQLILIEDAMMVYRVVRSPERRIFYIDVGAIPPEEIDNYMQQQKANLRSNTIIDKTTGRVDLRYNPLSVDEDYFIARRGADSGTEITTLAGGQHVSATEDVEYIQKKLFAALKVPRAYLGYDEMLCLTGDTLIPLTDGRVVSLEEMVKMHQRGEELEVYSYDLVKNKIAAGKVTAAWKTKEVDELYEVQLDDGNIIKCTANHPFLGRDGQYYRADQLKIGQSLMPLYRRLSSKKKGEYLEGYEQTYDVKRNRWRYTHRLFGEQKYPRLTNKNVIHHANFDRKNNKTSNLLKFSDQATHQYFHAIHNRATKKYAGSNNPRFNHTANIDELIKIAADVGSFNELKEKSGYGIRVISRMLKEAGHTFQSFSDNYMPKATGSYRGKGYDVSYNDIDNVMKERYAAGKSLSYHAVAQQMSLPPIVVLGRIKNSKWGSWSAYKDSMLGLDAKTLREELCKYKTKTELYQTKYEKLCSLTKFNRMVKLATKPSQYNNHKVIAIHRVSCHKVSVYDLTVEGFHNFALVNPGDNNSGIFVHNSSKATLAQEDIRFSRTVQAIQKVVISELQKLAYIHLFMNGYEGSDMFDFELRLTNPSTIAQQQKLELYNRKFEVLGNALGIGEGRVFSQQYLLKTIMDMSEQQQKQLSDEVVEDVQRMAALGKIAEGAIPESVGFSNNGSFNNAAYDDAVGVDGADTEGGDDADGGDDPFGDLGGGGGGGMGDLGGGDDFGDLGGDEGGDEEEPIEDGQVRRGNVLGEKEEADTTRLSDVDDADESTTKLSDVDVWGSGPIKADPKARHRKYNSDRRRRSGRAALHMPDFARSTGMRDPQDDPFGDALGKPFKGALDKPFKNPFGEARRSKGDVITSTLRGYMAAPKSDYEARPRITSEMQAIFDKLSEEFGATSNETAAMLTETDMMERLLREGGDLSTSETDEELNENNVKFFNDLIRDDD